MALFTRIILLATLSTLLPYLFSSLSCFIRSQGDTTTPRPTRRASLIAAGAFVYAVVAIAGAGQDVVYLGFQVAGITCSRL